MFSNLYGGIFFILVFSNKLYIAWLAASKPSWCNRRAMIFKDDGTSIIALALKGDVLFSNIKWGRFLRSTSPLTPLLQSANMHATGTKGVTRKYSDSINSASFDAETGQTRLYTQRPAQWSQKILLRRRSRWKKRREQPDESAGSDARSAGGARAGARLSDAGHSAGARARQWPWGV